MVGPTEKHKIEISFRHAVHVEWCMSCDLISAIASTSLSALRDQLPSAVVAHIQSPQMYTSSSLTSQLVTCWGEGHTTQVQMGQSTKSSKFWRNGTCSGNTQGTLVKAIHHATCARSFSTIVDNVFLLSSLSATSSYKCDTFPK